MKHYITEKKKQEEKNRVGEIPGVKEWYEGKLRPVVDSGRRGWWRFHEHYDRNGYCDNPARGY